MSPDEVIALLTALGDTSGAVAGALFERGHVGDEVRDPVEVYLQACGALGATVGLETVSWPLDAYHCRSALLPKPVRRFLHEFLGGRHPQLEGS